MSNLRKTLYEIDIKNLQTLFPKDIWVVDPNSEHSDHYIAYIYIEAGTLRDYNLDPKAYLKSLRDGQKLPRFMVRRWAKGEVDDHLYHYGDNPRDNWEDDWGWEVISCILGYTQKFEVRTFKEVEQVVGLFLKSAKRFTDIRRKHPVIKKTPPTIH